MLIVHLWSILKSTVITVERDPWIAYHNMVHDELSYAFLPASLKFH